MIVYHGSNCAVDRVDLNKCRPFKDFGRGFYTTELRDQAWLMAKRAVKMFGGSPVLNEFWLDEGIFADEGIKVKRFLEPNTEWATFIINNRNWEFTEVADLNCNRDNKYDVVIGAVANDDIRLTMDLYIDGRLTAEGLLKALWNKRLTQQTSFHTDRALRFLRRSA